MKRFRTVLALVALVAPAACAGGNTTPPAGPPPVPPGATAPRTPSDSGTAVPGESAMGLPGESAMGLPGAQFACPGLPATGTASCTVALNLNVPPISDAQHPAALIPGLHPADLQSAYGIPDGTGGTVAVVDAYGDPAAEADLGVYRTAFGLPPCTTSSGCLRIVDQQGGGTLPAADPGWAQETALDLAMVSAACPHCSIVLVETNSASLDDLGSGVDTAVRLGARAVSNSYYAIEWPAEGTEDVHFNHPGVAITASSGDRGYASYPAVSPYVLAVGGTTLTKTSSGWSDAPWAYAGQGCSAYVSRRSWQPPAPCGTRSAVDASVVADPQTGVAFFEAAGGGWLVAGGTSVGAPLVAAMGALSSHPAGPAYAYAHQSAFRDVAPKGYDDQTGLGVPIGVTGL